MILSPQDVHSFHSESEKIGAAPAMSAATRLKYLGVPAAFGAGGFAAGYGGAKPGHWRKIKASYTGKDKDGNPVKGKTWVKGISRKKSGYMVGGTYGVIGGALSLATVKSQKGHLAAVLKSIGKEKEFVRRAMGGKPAPGEAKRFVDTIKAGWKKGQQGFSAEEKRGLDAALKKDYASAAKGSEPSADDLKKLKAYKARIDDYEEMALDKYKRGRDLFRVKVRFPLISINRPQIRSTTDLGGDTFSRGSAFENRLRGYLRAEEATAVSRLREAGYGPIQIEMFRLELTLANWQTFRKGFVHPESAGKAWTKWKDILRRVEASVGSGGYSGSRGASASYSRVPSKELQFFGTTEAAAKANPSATLKAVKKRYRKIALDTHPDRHPGDAAKEKAFKEASSLYASLQKHPWWKALSEVTKTAFVKELEKISEVAYRGTTFPGYGEPIPSSSKGKKKMVLVKRGDKVRIVHFGQKGYEDFTQHKDKKRQKNYLTRSAGIKNKEGKLTKDDPFSPNYWARRELW